MPTVLWFLFTCVSANCAVLTLWPLGCGVTPWRTLQGSLPFQTSAYHQDWSTWSQCCPNTHKSTISLEMVKEFGMRISLGFMSATWASIFLSFTGIWSTMYSSWKHGTPRLSYVGNFVDQVPGLLWDMHAWEQPLLARVCKVLWGIPVH